MSSGKRDEQVLTRFTYGEKQMLEATAKLLNITVSDLIRNSVVTEARRIREIISRFETALLGSEDTE